VPLSRIFLVFDKKGTATCHSALAVRELAELADNLIIHMKVHEHIIEHYPILIGPDDTISKEEILKYLDDTRPKRGRPKKTVSFNTTLEDMEQQPRGAHLGTFCKPTCAHEDWVNFCKISSDNGKQPPSEKDWATTQRIGKADLPDGLWTHLQTHSRPETTFAVVRGEVFGEEAVEGNACVDCRVLSTDADKGDHDTEDDDVFLTPIVSQGPLLLLYLLFTVFRQRLHSRVCVPRFVV
jgi:hypothetical protein